jgi:plastocyanin
MFRGICFATFFAVAITSAVNGQQSDYSMEKAVALTSRGGKLVFVEKGRDQPEPVTIVVGQKVRFENKDNDPHTITSTPLIDGQPLFSTGVIQPGQFADVLFDIDLFARAGGKTGNVVTIRYRNEQQTAEESEIYLLSAAKR